MVAVAGIFWIRRASADWDRRSVEIRLARIDALTASFQRCLRENGREDDKQRSALETWFAAAGPAAEARFIWKSKVGLVFHPGIEGELLRELSGFKYWYHWKSPGKKSSRCGLLDIAGKSVLWSRERSMVYGVVYGACPVVDEGRFNWAWYVVLVVCVMGLFLSVGGYALYRSVRRERLESAMKSVFIDNISHELKTPLAGIGMWAEMLQDGVIVDDAKRNHAYAVIFDENRRMTKMVDELLDFSRLEGGRRRYDLVPINALDAATGALDSMRGAFPAEVDRVLVSIDDGIRFMADVDAVHQILCNLIGNAFKYAPGSEIELAARVDGSLVCISVLDRGPGIPADKLKCVFDRFWRAEGVVSSGGPGGLGIGLSISKALARGMDGNLTVANREGGGAEFTLSLPIVRGKEVCNG